MDSWTLAQHHIQRGGKQSAQSKQQNGDGNGIRFGVDVHGGQPSKKSVVPIYNDSATQISEMSVGEGRGERYAAFRICDQPASRIAKAITDRPIFQLRRPRNSMYAGLSVSS